MFFKLKLTKEFILFNFFRNWLLPYQNVSFRRLTKSATIIRIKRLFAAVKSGIIPRGRVARATLIAFQCLWNILSLYIFSLVLTSRLVLSFYALFESKMIIYRCYLSVCRIFFFKMIIIDDFLSFWSVFRLKLINSET